MRGGRTWHDPARDVRLRFGTFSARHFSALGLLFAGGIAVQLVSAYTLLLGLVGLAASIAGWIVVPSRGWRRCLAVLPGIFGVASLLNGALTGSLVALTLMAWLLVRMRPLASYPVIALPFAAGIVLGQIFPQYGAGAVVAAVLALTLIASAWGGWLIALVQQRYPRRRMPSA